MGYDDIGGYGMNEQTTITLPIETKREVRIAAAMMNLPMGSAALELIRLGLVEHKKRLSNESETVQPADKPAA